MQRRRFPREFKVEAVKLVRDRRVSVSQAARDLDVHENVLRKWSRSLAPILFKPCPVTVR
jgi:transposase-like protein